MNKALFASYPFTKQALPAFTPAPPSADYLLVHRALSYIAKHWQKQPEVQDVADAIGLSSPELTILLRRWAGLSPKAFLQAVTLDQAKRVINETPSLFDAAHELGLSGTARLHDLFVTHEAMSPGEYKAKGAGLTITFGFHPSPFGTALALTTPRGLCGLGFCDEGEEEAALQDMIRRWPLALYREDKAATEPFLRPLFNPATWGGAEKVKLFLIGTDFEVQVWEALLQIPISATTTYSGLAEKLGKPKAARAVGGAVGRNPISFVVPCHRVIGKSGALTGYHWGVTRKRAMLGWEIGQSGQ